MYGSVSPSAMVRVEGAQPSVHGGWVDAGVAVTSRALDVEGCKPPTALPSRLFRAVVTTTWVAASL